jgi:hypothetical protein
MGKIKTEGVGEVQEIVDIVGVLRRVWALSYATALSVILV